MTEQELREAIDRTKAEIYEIKHQLKSSTDPKKQKHLKSRLMELQYLQLWHLDQLG